MKKSLSGAVWSAAPTPFSGDWTLDVESVSRLADHHAALEITGVFIGGTSGEGPWLTRGMLRELALATVKAVAGRMAVAIQITDNSAARRLDNSGMLADTGVDMAVIAPPFFQMRPSQDYMKKLYLEVVENSPLPIGLYHRGKHSSVVVEGGTVAAVAAHDNVVMIKDSSADAADKDLFLDFKRKVKPELLLLNGNEFDCIPYLRDGYDGLLLGGACFTGAMAKRIFDLTRAGNTDEAGRIQESMNQLMYTVFGGKDITCWLSGQKQMMVELGVFSTSNTIINFPLTPECAEAIKSACRDYLRELKPY